MYQLWTKSDSQKENLGSGLKAKWRRQQSYFILSFPLLSLKIGSFGGFVCKRGGAKSEFSDKGLPVTQLPMDQMT